MKRTSHYLFLVVLFTLTIIFFTSCTNTNTPMEAETTSEITPQSNNKEKTIEGLISSFEEANLPVIDVVSYTSKSDLNELLGRPGEYIQKTNFNDSRFCDVGTEPVISIELFENKKDLEKRKNHLNSIMESSNFSALKYYMYDKDLILFRIPYDATPEEAKEYETVFDEYMTGKPITKFSVSITEDDSIIENGNLEDLGSTDNNLLSEPLFFESSSEGKLTLSVDEDIPVGNYKITVDVPSNIAVMSEDFSMKYNEGLDGTEVATGEYNNKLDVELLEGEHLYVISATKDIVNITLTPIND